MQIQEAFEVVNQTEVPEKDEPAKVSRLDKILDKIKPLLNTAFYAFHKYGLWLTVACGIGIYEGIVVSKNYYSSKIEEAILLEGMVYKQKVYTIIPK